MRGGAFVGEGAHACTFRPALLCADGTAVPKRSVSKAFPPAHRAHALREMAAAAVLRRLDPDQDLFYYPTLACDVPQAAIDATPSHCALLAREQRAGRAGDWAAVVLPAAHSDLFDFLQSRAGAFGRRELVALLWRAFLGVRRLARQGYVHQDVKLENVVVVRDADASLTTRLIDFGWFKTAAAAAKTFTPVAGGLYFASPPEYRFAQGAYEGDDLAAVQGVERTILAPAPAAAALAHAALLDKPEYARSLDKLRRDYASGRRTLDLAKTDVYGLGRALLEASRFLVDERDDEPGVALAFNTLLRRCLMPHPADRMTAEAAVRTARLILGAAATPSATGPRDVAPRTVGPKTSRPSRSSR